MDNPDSKILMFEDTAQKCCDKFYAGRECQIYDVGCSSSQLDHESIEDVGSTCPWHMDITHEDGCSNDDNYPEQWMDNPDSKILMFEDTAQKCCDKFYAGRECQIYDVGCSSSQLEATTPASGENPAIITPPAGSPATTPTKPNQESEEDVGPTCAWHPSQTFVGACAYSNTYPAGWDDPNWRHIYLFDTHEECCLAAHGVPGCKGVMNCEAESPTMQPNSGFRPTPPPTTLAPTGIFFIDYFSGLCLDGSLIVKPHYITTTYGSFESCCDSSFAKEACFAAGDDFDGGDTPAPSPSTYSPTMTLYYVEHFTRACVDATEVPMPHYVNTKETFTDYWSCCKTTPFRDQCFEEGLAPEPTSGPTQNITPDPSRYPSSSPSVHPSKITLRPTTLRPTEEDCSDAKWRYDSEYVYGCTNLEKSESDSATLFFQSWQECCQTFFARGRDCRIDNQCRTVTETIRFFARPRIANSCIPGSHPQYHPDNVHKDGCSNSLDFPDSWNEDENQGTLFFPTAIECCENVYIERGLDCNIRNVCAVITTKQPTPRPTSPCQDRPWHPDTDPQVDADMIGCSNSAYFPQHWIDDADVMLFDTAEECCDSHYTAHGLECNVHDTCPTEEESSSSSPGNYVGDNTHHSYCDSTRWHPSVGGEGTGVVSACSNSQNYPHQWNNPGLSSYMFFDDFLDCCQRHFPDEFPACRMDDVCAELTSSPTKTSLPSETTTSPISTEEVMSPSCRSAKWHITLDFSKCINDFDYPQTWEDASPSMLFDEAEACCLNVFNYADCEVEDICASNGVTSGPSQLPSQKPTPSTEIPSRAPSTKTPTPAPFRDISTSEPSVKITTSKPVHDSSIIIDDNPVMDPCSGNTKKKCKQAPLCTWNHSQRSCVTHVDKIRFMPVPSSMPSPEPTEETNRSRCTGKSQKQCSKLLECDWNKSTRSCSDSVEEKACEGRMYHPRSSKDRTCSNDGEYPVLWDTPVMSAKYLLPSGDQCCASFYSDGPCTVVNVCSTGNEPTIPTAAQDCSERKWHPITVQDRICTNTVTYPPLWDTPSYSEKYLLTSAEKCCKEFYSDGVCHKLDSCAD